MISVLVLLAALPADAAPLDPLAFASLAPLLDPSGPITVDTDTLTMTVGATVYSGVVFDGMAVWTFGSIVLDAPLYAEGSLPIGLLSQGDITIDAEIGIYARGSVPGPGGGAGGADPEGEAGGGPGGGDDEPGAGGGGFGGDGGDSEYGGDGGDGYGDLAVRVEGGSGGARSSDVLLDGINLLENGDGGGGGGAIEIGAVGRVDVTPDGSVLADGGDGETGAHHGGGGGSGGAIALHGQGGLCDGFLSARGGAGGDDGSITFAEGGGGGGGRIAMLDMQSQCVTDVQGGTAPNFGQADPGVVTFREWIDPDDDLDGWTLGAGDCDDNNSSVYPGAYDLPGDSVDADCDGIDPEPVEEDPQTQDTDLPEDTGVPGGETTDVSDVPDTVVGDPQPGEVLPKDEEEDLSASGACSCGPGRGRPAGLLPLLPLLWLARRRVRS